VVADLALRAPVARRPATVQSGVMADDSAKAFYWCLKHSRVESGDDVCAGRERLGPFATETEAQQALQRVKERNDEWEAEDERWEKGG
jgi:glycerol-3-phosphate dehydrogenase